MSHLQYLSLPPVLEVEEEPLPEPLVGEVTAAVPDPDHGLDDVDPLRHLGRLPQPGLGQVESHLFCHDHTG